MTLETQTRRATRQWVPTGSCVLVGVSGGPDSQALLDALAHSRPQLDISLVAVGVDHGIRPEAAKELDFACALAREHQVPFEIIRVQVEKGENIMAAARRARYRALNEVADRLGAQFIALGHTASDQVESILLNLTRGSGLRGARGIPPRRGRIVRPMLEVSRNEVLDYLHRRDIQYATDPSNADPRRARAQLRGDVVPRLRKINPALERAFSGFARSAREDEAFLRRLARQELEMRLGVLGSLAVTGFESIPGPVAGRLITHWLAHHRLRVNRGGVAGLLAACRRGSGGRSVSGVTVRVEAGRLWRLGNRPYDLPVAPDTPTEIPVLGLTLRAELQPQVGDDVKGGTDSVAFDCDCLHLDDIRVRSWSEGDRFQPFGLAGHTRVGDLFTDRKIPRALRAVWPLVVQGDEVLWVVGLRRGSGAPVTAGTRRVLKLKVEGSVLGW